MRQAFPLEWPLGYSRTQRRYSSAFKQTYDKAQIFLRDEISRLKGFELIVSTNLRVRNDGLIYYGDLGRKIEDPGVAIFFKYKDKDVTMCCDKYPTVWENMYALGKGIEALRGMDRWGVSDFLERSFAGFTALPESTLSGWWEVLEIPRGSNAAQVKDAYRKLSMVHHPDRGGSADKFQRLTEAYQEALKQF